MVNALLGKSIWVIASCKQIHTNEAGYVAFMEGRIVARVLKSGFHVHELVDAKAQATYANVGDRLRTAWCGNPSFYERCEAFPALETSFEGQIEVLDRTLAATVVPAFPGSLDSYENIYQHCSRAIQPHSTGHGTGTPFSSKPSKTRGLSDSCAEP